MLIEFNTNAHSQFDIEFSVNWCWRIHPIFQEEEKKRAKEKERELLTSSSETNNNNEPKNESMKLKTIDVVQVKINNKEKGTISHTGECSDKMKVHVYFWNKIWFLWNVNILH